jgi:hypothetical protein
VERAIWPDWQQIFGSGGRAAAAVQGHVDEVVLHTYAPDELASDFDATARMFSFAVEVAPSAQALTFEYTHSLSRPFIRPPEKRIKANAPIEISADNVLRFGMLEGSAIVHAKRCVYDPQDPFAPEPFGKNGSTAEALAIVCNVAEAAALTGATDPEGAAAKLLADGAAVVVLKAGPRGATVFSSTGATSVPAYETANVWTVGSGDVFAAMFAAHWAANGQEAETAAEIASRAVAEYVETLALPAPAVADLMGKSRIPAATKDGRVYLASPFFSMGERIVVEQAREALMGFGLKVFSPLHDVGPGPAADVAPKDLTALDECDVVFAILDGLDSGTVFEVGYARKAGKPVYALATTVALEDLKMVEGSGCKIYSDFVTAVHHTVWRT